jgi:hypothetical protein
MRQSPLDGVDLKVARAKGHLSDLKEAVKWALDSERYEFTRKTDPETGKEALWVDPIPYIALEWSVVIGEILFHLRSALDHLAYQLVALDGRTPTEQTKFPIRDSPLDKNGKTLPLRDLMPEIKSSKILAAINECQPYRGPDREPLWLLKVLNNIDKHRLLLVVIGVLDTGEMWWDSLDALPPTVSIRLAGPFKKGSPIAFFDFHGMEPPPDFEPHPALSIAFDEIKDAPMIRMEPYDGILDQICRYVEIDIIEQRFRPMF